MALTHPYPAYNAANDLEAHLVCNLLNDAEIEAVVSDDASPVGAWLGSMIPEVQKSRVMIDEADIDRARPLLDEYQRRLIERQHADAVEGSIEAICPECGERYSFPISQQGTVQNCPHCDAYIDVGDESSSSEWQEGSDDEPTDTQP